MQPWVHAETGRLERGAAPGMQRDNHVQLVRHLMQGLTRVAAAAGSSTLDGRWKVATTYPSGSRNAVRAAVTSKRSMLASSVSIIGLPTRCTALAGDAFTRQVRDRLRRRDEQQAAQLVGHAAG